MFLTDGTDTENGAKQKCGTGRVDITHSLRSCGAAAAPLSALYPKVLRRHQWGVALIEFGLYRPANGSIFMTCAAGLSPKTNKKLLLSARTSRDLLCNCCGAAAQTHTPL